MATTNELRAQAIAVVDAQAGRLGLSRADVLRVLREECAAGRRCLPLAVAADALRFAYKAADAVATRDEVVIRGGYPVKTFNHIIARTRRAVTRALAVTA
jgi:hypothetical protein